MYEVVEPIDLVGFVLSVSQIKQTYLTKVFLLRAFTTGILPHLTGIWFLYVKPTMNR